MKRFKYIPGIALLIAVLPALVKAQAPAEPLKISHLKGNCYVYTTYGTMGDGSRFPSNSMYVVTRKGVVMIDVPWDSTQLVPLLDSIQQRHGKKVIACIATHFHEDRTMGLTALAARGVKTYSTAQTLELCRQKKEEKAKYVIPDNTVLRYGDRTVEVFYPGAGHTTDNIVVWVPEDKILYGGCFIKGTDAEDLGNLSDARPYAWRNSMLKLKSRFPQPAVIVPGHGALDTVHNACDHTLDLIKVYEEKHPK